MNKAPRNSKNTKRRSAKSWSPLFAWLELLANLRRKVTTKPVRWRSKQHVLSIGFNKQLVVVRRTFRSRQFQKENSKEHVLVINNYPFPVREIAFRLRSKPHKRRQTSRKNAHLSLRRALPFVLIIFGLSGIVFFGYQTLNKKSLEPTTTFALPTPQAESTKDEPVKPQALEESLPTQVRITRLGIDYPVVQVGKLADGTMEVPPVLEKVTGWYKYGPTPGELGPAVIVGHVDSYKGPSVFWRLREVLPGDVIEVTRADGQTASFRVDSLQQFSQDAFPTDKVYGNIDHAGLRLITCGGTFNRTTGHYTENTVVFAKLII